MAAVVEKEVKRWTYEDYLLLEDDHRYEILDGELLTAPAPDTYHQRWLRKLFLKLEDHVTRHKLGEVFFAPLDVVFAADQVTQPDLVFISKANGSVIQRRGIFGVPDLLVEIVSPSSARNDRYRKKKLYARFGVKEYWLADPANETLEILTLKKGHYELAACAAQKGKVHSLVLSGLEFDLAEIL